MGALYAPTPLAFCPFLKKSSGNPYLKILFTFHHFLLRMLLWNKIRKCNFIHSQSTFGTPCTKTFLIFLLQQKELLISSNHFWMSLNFVVRFLGPPRIPIKKNKVKLYRTHMRSIVYQDRVKKMRGVHFWINFWIILKN